MAAATDRYSGDTDAQIAVWHSYVQRASELTKRCLKEQSQPFAYNPDPTKFHGLPEKVVVAIEATCLVAFSLEFRLKRVLHVLARRDLQRLRSDPTAKLSNKQKKCIGDLSLSSVIKCDEFWWEAGKYSRYDCKSRCCVSTDGDVHWNGIYSCLRYCVQVRNSFSHGDSSKLDKQLILTGLTSPGQQDKLAENTKQAFNGFVDIMAIVNNDTGYPIACSGTAAALAKYAHMHVV